jgi:hypothetical protein
MSEAYLRSASCYRANKLGHSRIDLNQHTLITQSGNHFIGIYLYKNGRFQNLTDNIG